MNKIYKNNIRLNDIKGCNRLLTRVINALIQDEISEEKARTIGYLTNIQVRALQVGDMEDRLNELEQHLEKRTG